eukprot:s533_g14.t2
MDELTPDHTIPEVTPVKDGMKMKPDYQGPEGDLYFGLTIATSSSSTSVSSTSTSTSTTTTSTSSTSSSSSSTSSSTTTSTSTSELTWCRKYHAGVPVESATCQAGSLEHDHCLTKVDSADVTCGGETSSAFCVASAAQSGSTSCDRCATVIMEDWNQEIYLSGEIRWAPFGSTEAEELLLEAYKVSAIDECGSELAVLGEVSVKSGIRYGAVECCAGDWYLFILAREYIPRAVTALAISSFQANLATTIPIFERTTTTSTTLTISFTVTSSTTSTSSSFTETSMTSTSTWTTLTTTTVTVTEEAPATVEGCMTLSVSDAALFAESSDAKEAIRKMVSRVAAVDAQYVQDIRTYAGESCPGARRLDQRRLQEAMRFDYVIAFPASLGVEVAIQAAEAAREVLQTASVEEVTEILVEEVQSVPTIANVVVAVTTISEPTVSVSVTTTILPISDALPTDDDTLAVAAVFIGLLFPLSFFVVYRRCQKRPKAVDDGSEKIHISVEDVDAKQDQPSDEDDDKSFTPVISPVPRKKKRRLKPAKNKALTSLTNTQVLIEPSPAPPELEAIAISWLEDESVIDLERTKQSWLEDEGVLFDRTEQSWLEDEGVLMDRTARETATEQSWLEDEGVLIERPPALPWDEELLFDRPNNTIVHESQEQSWVEVGVLNDRHQSRASCLTEMSAASQEAKEQLAGAAVFDPPSRSEPLAAPVQEAPKAPIAPSESSTSKKVKKKVVKVPAKVPKSGSSVAEEAQAPEAAPSESTQPKKMKKKVAKVSAKVRENTEHEAVQEENATDAKPKRVRKKVVKKSTKDSISTANQQQ